MKPSFSRPFLYVYVTCTGASVMALELAASRFLAPYFGTSMIVWANIIGLILLSLSVGYWLGGRIADKHPDGRILMMISLAAGGWTASLPLWGHYIFRAMSNGILNTPVVTIILSLVSILLVFAPPVLLLAMVSPFALRLVQGPPEALGKVAGNLYACSTLGSLVGTFGTAFGTIPFWGTRETLYAWSTVLIGISVIGLRHSRAKYAAGALFLIPILLYAELHGPTRTAASVVWSKDTLYQFVQVARESDGTTLLIYNEGGGVQSVHRPNDALSPDDYYDDYLALPYLTANPRGRDLGGRASLLVLGTAGGTIPHLLHTYTSVDYPQLHLTGVEIDPDVIPLDYRYFGLKPGEATLVNADARAFLHHSAETYDAVVVDAYTQQIYIPFHLSTREFFQEVRSHLRPGGLVALNVNAVSDHSRLLLSLERTVQSVFPHTYVMKANGEFNYIVVGSIQPVRLDRLNAIPLESPLTPIAESWRENLHEVSLDDTVGGMLLTDDRAPVELLTDSMILGYAAEGQ
jgi:spermidine synthase